MSNALTAIRGPVLTYTGDAFRDGLESTMRYEPDAIVAMQDFAAKTPNIPIPFHRLLKVVALVDAANPQVAALLERLRAENIEVEVSDRYSRDVSEDSDVGAYIASVDGARREHAPAAGAQGRRILR